MVSQYLIKLIQADLSYKPVDPLTDIFHFRGIVLNGVYFDDSNIVTVSGTNSLTTALAGTSSTLQASIDAVSGASSLRDDSQDVTIGALTATVSAVSGASSLRDDAQDLVTHAVSGNLQSQITAIVTDHAREERFTATSGQTLFTLSTIAFDPSPTRRDIVVYRNIGRTFMSADGTVSAGDYVKVGTNQVQWLYPLVDGDRVTVREERTGGGGGGGGSVDLENILVDPAPYLNGGQALGQNTKAWSAVYLKDTVLAKVWRLEIVSGTMQIVDAT